MNNSPTTPGGTGRNHPSSTYTRVFQIGTPIATPPDPPAYTHAVESTDASVGPYKLCNSAPHNPDNRSAKAPDNASPEHTTHRNGPHPPGSPPSTNTSNVDGTK